MYPPGFRFFVSSTKTHFACCFSTTTKSCLDHQTPWGVPGQVAVQPSVAQVRVTSFSSGGGSTTR